MALRKSAMSDLLESTLVEKFSVPQDVISTSARLAQTTHIPFMDLLVSGDYLSAADARRAMSEVWGIPLADLGPAATDASISRELSGQEFLRLRCLPLRRDGDIVIVATAVTPTDDLREQLTALMNAPVRFEVALLRDIRAELVRIYGDRIVDDATFSLWRNTPDESARVVATKLQITVFAALALALVITAVLAPGLAFAITVIGTSLVFLSFLGFKYAVSMYGAHAIVDVHESESVAARHLDDDDLPLYTILVPVYQESEIVAQLMENLGELEYPAQRLQVLILVEEDDDLTLDAIEAAGMPPNFEIIRIPIGQPRTKPKACNVGLYFADGKYLVIYDAEDKPDADQLKRAVARFSSAGPEVACIQAALNYFNADENTLTRMFTLEYSYWFDYMLPGLDALRLPIPLGGTSNHFETRALIEMGGWDPFNVTEDADLGIRASALGYRVTTLDSTTFEEANTSIPNFIRQRSRWLKGYMQTALVHMRDPMRAVRQVGVRRTLAFLLLIAGTPLTFLLQLPLALLMVATVVFDGSPVFAGVPIWVSVLCLLNLILGNLLIIYLNMMAPFKRGNFSLVLWAGLNPFYWILHTIAAYKGLWQLIVNPFYWEKTDHGLTKETNSDD